MTEQAKDIDAGFGPLAESMPPHSYSLVPSLVLYDLFPKEGKKPLLKPLDIVVYLVLRGHTYGKGKCWPSLDLIATEIGQKRRTIQRAVARLKQARHIHRIATRDCCYTYLLTDVLDGVVIRRLVKRVTFDDKGIPKVNVDQLPMGSAKTKSDVTPKTGTGVTSGISEVSGVSTK